jgi:hypothetical protein
MRKTWWLCASLAVVAGCDELQISAAEQPLSGGGAFAAADFGALPDDGVDDRLGLQGAVDAACGAGGGVVRLRAGLYEVGPNPALGASNIASISIRCSNVRLTGEGMASVVQATGDGGGGDWNLVQVRTAPGTTAPVRNVEIDNLLLSGAGAWNTDEQTHLVQIGVGPVEGVSLHHLWFHHPQRGLASAAGWERGGDCVRMLGSAAGPVRFVKISDSQFLDCDRSSIGFQRDVYDTLIDSNVFLAVGDQHIDQEPSGTGAIGRTIISHNLFLFGSQGAHSVTLTGNGIDEPSSEVVFSQNLLFGRGLSLMNVQRAVVSDNVIMGRVTSSAGVVHGLKANGDILLRGNYLERLPGSAPGPVVSVVPHNSGFPGRWKIDGNRIVSDVDGFPVNFESATQVSVVDNDIEFRGPTAGTYAAIRFIAAQGPVDGGLILGNRAAGPLDSVVQLSPTPYGVGAMSVVGNMSSGASTGVACKGTGTFRRPIVHSGYNYDGASSAARCPAGPALVAQYP